MDKEIIDQLKSEFVKYKHYWEQSGYLKDLIGMLDDFSSYDELNSHFPAFDSSFKDLIKSDLVVPFVKSAPDVDFHDLKKRFILQTEAFYDIYYAFPAESSGSKTIRILPRRS